MTESEVIPCLKEEIRTAIADGFQTFISGMARGVDLWAAEIVLALRDEGAVVRLICTSPYRGFESRWSREWQERYLHIIEGDSNYASLTKTEHNLAGPQREAALKQVPRYVDRQHGDWSQIQQAEVDVSLVKPDYIIEGKIDLIRGDGDTVEIVDFKAERKPDMERMRARLEQYRRQLHIYAHLVEERTGQKVSKMHLYYTGEDGGVPTITYPYTKSAVEGTILPVRCSFTEIPQRMPFCCGAPPKQILCVQSLKASFGELTTAFCGVDPHPCQLIKLLNGPKDWLTGPVCRQQISRVILFSLVFDINAVPPVAGAGG